MDSIEFENWAWGLSEQWHKNHTIAIKMARASGLTNLQYCDLLNAGVLRTDAEVEANDAKEVNSYDDSSVK